FAGQWSAKQRSHHVGRRRVGHERTSTTIAKLFLRMPLDVEEEIPNEQRRLKLVEIDAQRGSTRAPLVLKRYYKDALGRCKHNGSIFQVRCDKGHCISRFE